MSFENDNPFAPWNCEPDADCPFRPWNNPQFEDDPQAPWNDPAATERDYERYCERHHIPDKDR